MNVVGINGSLRKSSYNKIILNKFEELLPDNFNYIEANINDLPLFNEDIENDNIESVNIFKNILNKADFIFIMSPEYNYSIPGGLKNALDWASRGENLVLNNKKIIIGSVSTGRFGGVRMQRDLKNVLLALNSNVLNQPEFIVSNVESLLTNNELTDERTIRHLNKIINIIKDS